MTQAHIRVTLPTDRDYVGYLTLQSGRRLDVSAKTAPKLNLPDPAVGLYRLYRVVDIDPRHRVARFHYGMAVAYLENCQTRALMPLHGGEADDDGRLLSTEGGLRVHDDELMDFIAHVQPSRDGSVRGAILHLDTSPLGWVGRRFRRRISNRPLDLSYIALLGGSMSGQEDLAVQGGAYLRWLIAQSLAAEKAAQEGMAEPAS